MEANQFYQNLNKDTVLEYPDSTLHGLIDQIALEHPNAISALSGADQLTYGELQRKSNQIASYLASKEIGRGDLVGLCCDRYVDTPALLVGILKTGAGYVPLDPDYPVDRLAYMVENSEVKHIIANSNQRTLVEPFGTPTTIIDQQWDEVATAGDSCPVVKINPKKDIAYVIYTSGSTGKPKGVLVPHSSVVNFLWSLKQWPGFTKIDRLLATTTLSFDISVLEMFLPLVTGGSLAVVDRETAKDSAALVKAIEQYKVTLMQATPAMWRMILEADFAGGPHMKFITGGEPLPRDLIAPMLERCGELWNLYGPTETTVWSSGAKITSAEERILIGVPFANTQLYIVDENNELCPPETPGELLIAGDGMTLGYLKRDELTAEKFCDWKGHHVYRTGDLARLTKDGQIDHMGRIDSQIKFNGHRIELGEIDAAMAVQPGVRLAATVLREDRPGDKRLVGYLLPKEGETPNVAQVRAAISESLPIYMVPNTIVVTEEFHYTPSGKLDRKAFPPPSTNRPDIAAEFVAPRSDAEKQLASIWSDILQIDDIGVQDNFLDLGGNSIRAVGMVARVEKEMGVTATPGEFFDNPTIQSLLGIADRKQKLLEEMKSKSGKRREGSGSYAIVGMAARMPGAADLSEFWDNLVHGRESIRFFKPEELDPTLDPEDTSSPNYVAARGIVDDADCFDARFFKMPPKAAELTDPQQRLVLELAWTALEDAGIIPAKSDDTIGIWAGSYTTTYFQKNILPNRELIREVGEFNAGVYNEKDYIATRVAHALNLTGPAINVNTACSTALVALIEACKSLDAGDCDVALAGGSSVTFPQKSGHLHQTGSIFSPDGHCRPFDSEAAGTLFCDGAGLVVVKRLEDAIADNDRIYAVVKGYGINNDGGEKASFSAPSINGQASAIAMAQSMGDFDPETISYIEAHGTATPIGDPIEVSALRTVFEAKSNKKQYCAIGSVKSNIGHTVAAAGVAGLIKVAMSMHTEQIPATLHYKNPNPQIDFENSPFYVCDSLTPWQRGNQPRRAGVSSFGVGGTNAHIVLEEAPLARNANNTETGELPVAILPVSGVTEAALEANVDRLASEVSAAEEQADLHQIAAALQVGRDEFTQRAVVVSDSMSDAADVFTTKKAPRFLKRKASKDPRDVVFMFPGQGAQYVRMGQDLYEHSEIFRENLDTCAEILTPLLGRDLREVLFPAVGDEDAAQEILKNTQFTQPALFSLGYSLAKVWMAWGVQPSALMGHSIGEFAAACTAGVFSLEDGLLMIAERGRAMQALPGGSMMSVRLPGSEVERLLWGDMAIGSYNGPKLCVVAGPDDQVAELQKQLDARDVVCRHLHTSHAFHSPMMESIVEPFAEFVAQFQLNPPSTPILSTLTGEWMTDEQATDPHYWANHLRAPVRFSDAVTKMWDAESGDPSRILIELGPRKTLATLSKQHAVDPKKQISIPTLSDNAENNAEWRAMLTAVAQLWLSGASIDWSLLTGNGQRKTKPQHVSLPTYAFQRKRYFIEPIHQPVVARPEASATSQPAHQTEPVAQVAASPTESPKMSRIPRITASIVDVFESTSGFDLNEFEGDTTFFEMGLDSLVLTQTAAALKKELNVEVTFRQLLENTSTLDSLAAWLDEELPADQLQAEPVAEVVAPQETPQASAPTAPQVAALTPHAPAISEPVVAAQPVAPAHAQMTPAATVPTDDVQGLIKIQLQLMQQQMQLLAGQPVAVQQVTTQPSAVQAVVAAPVVPELVAAKETDPCCDPSCCDSSNCDPATCGTSCCTPESTPKQTAAATTSHSKSEKDDAAANSNAASTKRFKTVKLNEEGLSVEQEKALEDIVHMNNTMMPKSKAYAQKHRRYMADPRTVSGFRPNMKEMTHPIVVDRSKGVHLWDIDGNEYIDFTCGFGSNFLGHTHDITVKAISEQVQKDYAIGPQSPLAGEVAKLFCDLTGHERMAFSNTGSEAVLGCTRLARNFTGRDLIVMFNGDYHGILDEVIARGSKKLKSFPAATGIPKDYVGNTLILDYGTDETLEIIRDRMDDIAAVLVEPVQSRKPELQPREFLQELGRMTAKEPTALIFDEVISGLRIGLGGAQEYFGVKADLASYGKIFGGGMPIGLIGGKEKYMDGLDGGFWSYGDESRPEAGMTYFAGTFVRHPLTLAASKAIMEHVRDGGRAMYDRVNRLGDYLADEMNRVFKELDAPLYLANFGTLFKIQFHQELIYSEVFFAGLRRRGMHIWDHRPCLLTLAHQTEHVDEFVKAMYDTVVECQRHGFMPGEGYKKVTTQFDATRPPQKGARVGKDKQGKPGWFVPDAMNPGQYLQVGFKA